MYMLFSDMNKLKFNSVAMQKFVWLDRKGCEHDVDNMDTRYIFNKLKMIWNHKMPNYAKIQPLKKYRFSKFYTDTYLANAILCFSISLNKRSDLSLSMKNDLDFMIDYLKNKMLIDMGCEGELLEISKLI